MGIIVFLLLSLGFSAVDGVIGKVFLADVLPTWGYWDFFGAAVFISACVGTSLLLKD